MKQTKKQMMSSVTKAFNESKIVGNNTLLITYSDGSKAIRLHNTDVFTVSGNFVTLNSDGWLTPTTKDRINYNCLNDNGKHFISISQHKSLWYVHTLAGIYDYFDGIQINTLTGKPVVEKQRDESKVKKLKKDIAKFVALITKDNLPVPNSGDCWLCSFHTEDGKTWGDSRKDDNDHLLSHLEEGYLHGSLLVNAMREKGYNDSQISIHYSYKFADTFKRAVRQYLQKRLIK